MSLENTQHYYGRVLQGSADLRTDACCTLEPPPPAIRSALARIHPEVSARYYGCGLVVPERVAGARILDLGCGSGRDVFLLSQLVGASGSVLGIDATAEQLAVAREHRDWHRDAFGYAASNVDFVAGDIARLDELDLEPGSFDVIVSNCVINLVADKAAVFAAAHRLLKEGGELYFSDVYADRRLPPAWRDDPVLHGECLAGALYWGDFLTGARAAGFVDPRLVTDRPLTVGDAEVAAKVAGTRFFSATYRLFKLAALDMACEDHGQAVRYRGAPGSVEPFHLDKHHAFEPGRIMPVCGNTFRMVAETRFAPDFDLFGDFTRHFGIFSGCGTDLPFGGPAAGPSSTACC
ncbi:methyltransferase domain-containing protein [Methylobacterium sp. WL120]|uniref:methyltransferase domain-containing protein n=1 Tax=Methylobacterium sp. WL120 TaxID=2603887 RepID=UPI0011C9F299|nr:methyltransferase domain-containing protein [Methylobacterium sp. WL120]TXM70717.1 methyltransferase domain-containing protein [Methylobacterium sp. WL120]